MTPQQAIKRVENAGTPHALLGTDPEAEYRKLLILVHPDRFPPADRPRAEKAALKLDNLPAVSGNAGGVTRL